MYANMQLWEEHGSYEVEDYRGMRAYSLWFLLDTHNGAIGDSVGCLPISWGNIGSLGKYLKIHSSTRFLILL